MGLTPINATTAQTLLNLLNNLQRINNKISNLNNPTNNAYISGILNYHTLINGSCEG